MILPKEKDEFGKEREYFFIANGQRYRIGDEDEKLVLFKNIIDKSERAEGDEVYLIEYREGYGGCHDLGWMVINDVDNLYSKIFQNGRDSITDVIGSDPKDTSIIIQFRELLDANGLKYQDEWVRMD